MKNDLINVFIGSDIESQYIASLLIDNQVKCFVQNTLEESISAGWASGSTYNSSTIRVDANDFNKAQKIINEYLNSRNDTLQ